jgi:ATP-binding cassette subfamily F protein uup
MALLSVQNLTLGFGAPPLLEDITFHLEAGERVALVGRNGAGKSTFMQILCGEIAPGEGNVATQKGAGVAYLPQEVPTGLAGSVFDIVASGAAVAEYQVNAVLTRMQLDGEAAFDALSGGMKRRVLLARALVTEPDVLLLDEPTNHLDIDSIRWLEEFLPRAAKSLLFVTHDRVFLQNLATRIIEIDRGKLTSYACDYAAYLERKAADMEAEAARQEVFDKKLAEEEAWIRRGIKARRTRDEGRVRALIKMREERRARRSLTGTASIATQDAERSGKLVFEAEHVDFGYENTFPERSRRDGNNGTSTPLSDRLLIQNFSTIIMRGDKVGIIGANGSGKTTLLQLLLGKLTPQMGSVKSGTKLQIAYFDQLRAQLDEEKTVWQNVAGENQTVTINGRQRHIIGYLNDFLFSRERAHTPVKVLSGGERNRLLLAKLFTQPANLLVMDEPTNDLDIETLDLLEELLLDFDGTLLLVSHDRAFLNNVVTSVIAPLGDGRWEDSAGGYDDWLRARPAPDKSTFTAKKEKPRREQKPDKPRKLTFKEKQELKELPLRIETWETEQREIYDTLADPAFYQNGGDARANNARLEVLKDELATAYARWEELEEIEN